MSIGCLRMKCHVISLLLIASLAHAQYNDPLADVTSSVLLPPVHNECTQRCDDRPKGQYLHCNRCDAFVICIHHRLTVMPCPQGTIYHGKLGVCVHGDPKTCRYLRPDSYEPQPSPYQNPRTSPHPTESYRNLGAGPRPKNLPNYVPAPQHQFPSGRPYNNPSVFGRYNPRDLNTNYNPRTNLPVYDNHNPVSYETPTPPDMPRPHPSPSPTPYNSEPKVFGTYHPHDSNPNYQPYDTPSPPSYQSPSPPDYKTPNTPAYPTPPNPDAYPNPHPNNYQSPSPPSQPTPHPPIYHVTDEPFYQVPNLPNNPTPYPPVNPVTISPIYRVPNPPVNPSPNPPVDPTPMPTPIPSPYQPANPTPNPPIYPTPHPATPPTPNPPVDETTAPPAFPTPNKPNPPYQDTSNPHENPNPGTEQPSNPADPFNPIYVNTQIGEQPKTQTIRGTKISTGRDFDFDKYGNPYHLYDPTPAPTPPNCPNCYTSCEGFTPTNMVRALCDDCCYVDCSTGSKICP